MKKKYVIPTAKVVNVGADSLLASVSTIDEVGGEQLGKKYQIDESSDDETSQDYKLWGDNWK